MEDDNVCALASKKKNLKKNYLYYFKTNIMAKKKISILTLSMGSGGAEKFVSLMLPELINDFDVHSVIVDDVRHFDIPAEVKIEVLNSNAEFSFIKKIFYFPLIIIKYHKYIRSNSVDISLSLLTRPNIINAFIKFLNPKLKIVISERCFPSIAYKSSKFRYNLYKLLIPLFYNKADKIFSNSLYINEDLRNNFGVTRPMEVIYNSIKAVSERDVMCNNNLFDIIWIGKLVAIKNPRMLFEALKISNRIYDVQVLGAGNLETSLKSYSSSSIQFRGNVNNVFNYIKQSKCLVLTSNSEGFPNVILEGMSYGLPVISTNCTSGPLEILNDNEEVNIPQRSFKVVKYGILVNVNDSLGLSKAIDKLFSDEELYEKLSTNSLSRAKDYSAEKIYFELKKLIT